jgi:predicted HAD superfamily Cof-like phosphohydrolase
MMMASITGIHYLHLTRNPMSLDTIQLWHKRARPEPTFENFNVQLGCHIEEIAEMFDTVKFSYFDWSVTSHQLKLLADALKAGFEKATITDRKEFLDSLADQVVTAVGTGHCAGMDSVAACYAVNESNWTKYGADGQPVFNDAGKIMKGSNYKKPDLEGMY